MKGKRIDGEKLKILVINILNTLENTDFEQAQIFAESLIWSDRIGRGTHGVWRLPTYYKRMKEGLIKCPCQAVISRPTPSFALINGDHGLGQYVGHLSMNTAIEMAQETGIAAVGVNSSNHFGTGAYFVNLAAESNMIGICMSNSTPKLAPHGGVKPVFGTNPIAFGAPQRNGHHILFDMSTASLAGSAIMKIAERNGTLPEGICVDKTGIPITDPEKVNEGALLPFGGAKGYGLALFIEILAGVITNAGFSHNVKSMFNDFDNHSDVGHFFIAIDIGKIISLESYYSRLEDLVELVRLTAGDGMNVLLPGEKRWQELDVSQKKGVFLDNNTIVALKKLAEQTNQDIDW